MEQVENDETLVALFRNPATKEAAFTAIVNKYRERLYWHIRRLVIVHEDTDDILQNVFIKSWKGLDRFREDSSLYTWLYRISTNESLSFLQNLKKRRAINAAPTDYDLTSRIKADPQFNARKIEWKLQLAIQQLPEQQRLIFNLRYFDEMPYQKMSELLGVTEGALKASYHHAAKKVENYLLND
ncbi:RNA polymerase subunit sigma [Niabella ginsenosidivorans]|uniref:RNA polymerase sigma factor n=1 Tax=Niabella ginsenosidivorans TaxID=1176587 RepID=A0A1A9HZ60_9BACT|nr:RNA polymerase sigma factor [Niabella ginsenosidivorans]ANH79761.1 RNA polymerase subunit sigma [Niabella ginsenosidivorans]